MSFFVNLLGFIPYFIAWSIMIIHFVFQVQNSIPRDQGPNPEIQKVPDIIYAIIGSLLFLESLFGVVQTYMTLPFYKNPDDIGKTYMDQYRSRRFKTEICYCILSLASKTCLAWMTFYGVKRN